MNSPNPFVPQGSLLEQQSKRRSRLKVAVFCVLAVGITGLTAMLIQGCKREQPVQVENPLPPIETNEQPMNATPPPIEASNLPPAEASNLPPVETSNLPEMTPPPVVVTPPVAPSVAPTPAQSEYIVVKGDSLWKIARNKGVTLKALKAANPGVDPARLSVGERLVIPAPTSSAAGLTTGMTGSSGMGSGQAIYIVKSGDTLTRIARHYGTTVKAIESANNLITTRIKVGQKLKIPSKDQAPAPAAAPAPAPDTTQ